MLRTLYIENIAVIEKTSIDFENGLNVLTGETGAGKSIIIDAINAIMGQRTSKEIIRTEADSAFVSAQFDDINQSIVEKLDELGFSDDEGMLILQRTLNRNGRITNYALFAHLFPACLKLWFNETHYLSVFT